MNSRQALKLALKGADRNAVAKAMDMQIGSLNNQVAGERPYFPKGKTLNFVDRVMECIAAIESENGTLVLLEWMAEQMSCVLIKNPVIGASDAPAVTKVSEILRDFAGMIEEIGKATADMRIENHEAEKIREKWETAKRTIEGFVLACETGIYDQQK